MEKTPEDHRPSKKSFLKLIWQNKTTSLLILIILCGSGWFSWKYFSLKMQMAKEKEILTNRFIQETSRVFSWSVRGELLRENKEQVNQFFLNLIKEPGFKKIRLIDAKSLKTILSTDKKDEGQIESDTTILHASEPKLFESEEIIRSVVPVMGLDSKMAILVIDRNP